MNETQPWTQTATGKAVDLLNPQSSTIDFENDVGPALGKMARFAGATRGETGYSIAQHCVLGAEAIFAETGSHYLAACFVLHDAHEYVLTDLPTPALTAYDEVFGAQFKGAFKSAVRTVKERLDHAIFEAAGLRLPDAGERAALKAMDTRMMMAERRALMSRPPRAWFCESVASAHIDPLDLEPWGAATASAEWLGALWTHVGEARL